MNKGFVYRGMLVKFDELIGWFINDENGNRFSFRDKEICKDFISKMLVKD
jgi:hypothetical protein